MKRSFFLIIALIAGASTQLQAQERRHVDKQVAEACKQELQQLCKGQKGKELECLRNNDSKLSAQCKGALPK